MKLSLLHEQDVSELSRKLRWALNSPGGSPGGGSFLKRQQDPMSPERQGYASTDQNMKDTKGTPVLQYRSGHQKGTATNPRHRKFLGVPDSGADDPIRPDSQMSIGGGETKPWLGPGGYGSSIRSR